MKIFKVILFCFLVVNVQAQVVFHSAEESIEYALKHNKLHQSEAINTQQSQATRQIKSGALLPQVKASALAEHYFSLPVQLLPAEIVGGEPGTFRPVRFGLPYTASGSLNANWNLFSPGRINDLKIAKIDENIAQEQFKLQENNLKEDVTIVWYSLLQAAENLKIAQENLSSIDTLWQATKHKDALGLVDPLDANRLRILLRHNQMFVTNAERTWQNRLDQFKLTVGVSMDEAIEIKGQLVPETTDEQLGSLDTFPDDYSVNIYKMMEERRYLELRKSRMDLLPEVSVYGNFTRQAFSESLDIFSSDALRFNIGVVGLRIDMPIFTGMQRKNQIVLADLKNQQASLERQYQSQRSLASDKQLLRDYAAATENLERATEARENAQVNYNLATFKYDGGMYGINRLIDIYQEKLQADSQYLEQMTHYLIAKTKLEIRKHQ
ncbi:MAG: TolC family protein [Cyclobacteriaceae bacterium]